MARIYKKSKTTVSTEFLEGNFTQINNDCIRDSRLSSDAFRILCIYYSNDKNFNPSVAFIKKVLGDISDYKWRMAWNLITKYGYGRKYMENGKWIIEIKKKGHVNEKLEKIKNSKNQEIIDKEWEEYKRSDRYKKIYGEGDHH